jgi:hypothetical protein
MHTVVEKTICAESYIAACIMMIPVRERGSTPKTSEHGDLGSAALSIVICLHPLQISGHISSAVNRDVGRTRERQTLDECGAGPRERRATR